MDEILLIDKPAGMTSFGVVARVRRKLTEELNRSNQPELKRQRVKVGHTGTLDPFATGLMILLVGKGTKRSNEFLKLDKVYDATIRLGQTSSTGDPEGDITCTASPENSAPSQADIEKALRRFVGDIEQTPPIYSAIKIDGQRAYALARKGQEVAMPSRRVTIYALDMLDYAYPDLRIRAHVSSGTYIRTLAEDIGKTLGVGAYCCELRRIRTGPYDITQTKTLADLGILS